MWSAGDTTCSSAFLRSASEQMRDGIGNENGLCESSETCIAAPNLGAYQGHGTLESVAFTDGTITGVTLLRYSQNGR